MRVVLAKTAYSPHPEIGRRLLLRRVRRARARWWRRGPICRSISARCPMRSAPSSRPSAPTCTTATSSSTTIPISAAAICPTSTWCGPAFHEGRLLGYACLRAHWPDVGSATPGSYGAVTEIFGEGLRLPPLRLDQPRRAQCRPREGHSGQRPHARRAQGRPRRPARRHAARDRAPGGAGRALRRATSWSAIWREVMDYSERLMRATLIDLPDGEGTLRGFLRRRRHCRRRVRRRRAVPHLLARQKDRRPTDRGLRRHRPASQRAR